MTALRSSLLAPSKIRREVGVSFCSVCLWAPLVHWTNPSSSQAERGTQEAGFDCGSEQLRRFTSGVLLFKNHLSLKPHGNEFPQSSALIFLSGGGTPGGLHPLELLPGPRRVKPV